VRRKAQTQRHFPHLKCVDVRGNLNTRLRKLDASSNDENVDLPKYDCLILAAAGLKRIDLGHRISQYLSAEDGVLYAPGQGALGLEIRAGDERMLEFLSVLADGPTTLACSAERSLLKTSVISPDGKEMVEAKCQDEVVSEAQAVKLGRELAEKLLEMGADAILKEIRAGAAH
jgi:hydroxymethylbilane synthase